MRLTNFFKPRSITIIGASNNQAKLGWQILNNIITGGFKGKIYPVNLNDQIVGGLTAYSELSLLPTRDFAKMLLVVAIPAPLVFAEIKKAAELGIKNIIIISAGFKEIGGEGQKREQALIDLATHYHLNILGPNCLGFVNTRLKLNATFAKTSRTSGGIALLSQSGAVGAAMLDWFIDKNCNLAYFISLGNKSVLDENNFLEYLATDKEIKAVALYLEEITDGQRFMEIVSRLSGRKPVLVLKAGTSIAGSKLARSHTGSLAGSAAVTRVGIERAGGIWIENLTELFNLIKLLNNATSYRWHKPELKIITNAGGLGVLTADIISREGLSFGGSQDLLGDASALKYRQALIKTLEDKNTNNLLVLLTPQTSTEILKTAEAIVAMSRRYPTKLIMTSFVGGPAISEAKEFFNHHQISIFDCPEEAVRSFSILSNYQMKIKLVRPYRLIKLRPQTAVTADYLRAIKLLNNYQIPFVKTVRYQVKATRQYHYPVVLKAVGPDFIHKTDKGGVIKNILTPSALVAAARDLNYDHQRSFLNKLNYLVVQEQKNDFQEIILGFKRDVAFGPVLVIGWGGIYAEIIKDIKLSIADLNLKEALRLINSLKIADILNGARGQKAHDIKTLAKTLIKLAKLAGEHPEIAELDINPLFVYRHGVIAADVRVILTEGYGFK